MTSIAQLMSALLAAVGAEGSPEAPAPIQDAPPVEYPQWTGTLALGATWTDGNTESETFGGTFNAVRRGEEDRWTLDLYSNYGKARVAKDDPATPAIEPEDTDTTTNNSGGALKYDYFYSKKLYLYGNGSGKVDHVADLDLRYILGAGAGYQVKESEKLKWGTEVGLSYVDEDFGETVGQPSADADFAAVRLASILACQISKSSAFEQVAEVFPSLEESEDVIAKIDNRLKMTITGKWIAQIQYVLDFDGSVPRGNEETDHRVVLSIGWSLGS